MQTLPDRFRRWYEHERDCNAKSLEMLASVPADKQADPDYRKAVDKMAHLVAARLRWLHRLGHYATLPAIFPKDIALPDLATQVAQAEKLWVAYLAKLDDAELIRQIEWTAPDGMHYRFDVEGILTQVNGHAWYHRGQVAMLVAKLGGKAVDTDYLFWCKLTPLEPATA